jgi:hypothetical protein
MKLMKNQSNNKARLCNKCKQTSTDAFQITEVLSEKLPEYRGKVLCSECRMLLLTRSAL